MLLARVIAMAPSSTCTADASTSTSGEKDHGAIELTQADIGEFEAEKIASVSRKKMVHLKGYVALWPRGRARVDVGIDRRE